MMSMRSSPIEIFAHTVTPCPEHCRSTGNWLFCNRRWLSPSHPPDRARLDAGYDALCAALPAFAACPRHRFLARLAHVSESWSAARRPAPRTALRGLVDVDGIRVDWSPPYAPPSHPLNPAPPRRARPPSAPVPPHRHSPAPPALSPTQRCLHDAPARALPAGDSEAGPGGGGPLSPAAAAIRVASLLNPSCPAPACGIMLVRET
jgi:hypothetical protein